LHRHRRGAGDESTHRMGDGDRAVGAYLEHEIAVVPPVLELIDLEGRKGCQPRGRGDPAGLEGTPTPADRDRPTRSGCAWAASRRGSRIRSGQRSRPGRRSRRPAPGDRPARS
jgi:hypothetical protein